MPKLPWARSITRQAWPFAIAGLLLGELAIPAWLYPPLPAELDANPFARRDWDRYVERTSVKHDPEIRILLLSNSQGRGPEYASDQLYSSLLEQELNRGRTGPPVRVVNWSFGPNRVPEATVLLARAHDLEPHVTLAVFPPVWFDDDDYTFRGQPTPLSMFPGDVTDTAWFYRSRLAPAFRDHYLGPRTAIRAYLARYLPTFRLRDLPVSYLQSRFSWFAAFVPEGEKAAWFATGRGSLTRLRRQPALAGGSLRPNPTLLRIFDDTARALPTQRVFVFQPHCFFSPGAHEAVLPLQEQLARDGWEVWDMMDVVPWQEYLSGQNIHLSDSGHALFAHALAERLRPYLGD